MLGIIYLLLTVSSAYADITIIGKNKDRNLITYHVHCDNDTLSSVTYNLDLNYNPYLSARYNAFNTLDQAAKDSCYKDKQKVVNKGYILLPGKTCEISPLSLNDFKNTDKFQTIPLNKNGMYVIKANEGTFLYTTTLPLCKEAMSNL